MPEKFEKCGAHEGGDTATRFSEEFLEASRACFVEGSKKKGFLEGVFLWSLAGGGVLRRVLENGSQKAGSGRS